MLKWKKCPKCGRRIPENWNRHDKCGWNAEELKTGAETKRDEFIEEMEKSLIDSFDVIRRIKKKYPQESIQLDPTKIALTIFIQRRREKFLEMK
jgi:hypothetical protein